MKLQLTTAIAAVLLSASAAYSAPIHDAAKAGDIEAVKKLLAKGVDLDVRDGVNGRTPLMIAANYTKLEMVQLLITEGADVQLRWGTRTCLEFAAFGGNTDVVKIFLEKGLDVNTKSGRGFTPLHWAAMKGHTGAVALLLDHDANIDAQKDTTLNTTIMYGQKGWTPFQYAAYEGHFETAQLLIDRGANMNLYFEILQSPHDSRVIWTMLDFAIIEREDRHGDQLEKFLRKNGALTGKQYRLLPPRVAYKNKSLMVEASVGRNYDVLQSADLKTWKKLDTIRIERSPQVYEDPTAPDVPIRFYRLQLAQ